MPTYALHTLSYPPRQPPLKPSTHLPLLQAPHASGAYNYRRSNRVSRFWAMHAVSSRTLSNGAKDIIFANDFKMH